MTDSPNVQPRIVVGVDGSDHSVAALRWALREAVLTGARIDVVACWHRLVLVSAYVPAAYAQLDLAGATEHAARDAVTAAVGDVAGAADVVVETRVAEGQPAKVLVEAAAGAALLVVGARGHGELAELALGSVGLHCATHAPCPVLISRDTVAPANS